MNAGWHTVSLNVTFSQAGTYQVRMNIFAFDPDPLRVHLEASTTNGSAPLIVNFNANVTGGQAPFTYKWYFGDGTTSSEKNPCHVYSQAGLFDALVTVKGYAHDGDPVEVRNGKYINVTSAI